MLKRPLHCGLPYFFSFHSGGVIGLTFDQSASSSSATTAGSVVKVPCPISAAGDTMLMVPSVAIVSHTFSESGASAKASPLNVEPIGRHRQGQGEAGRCGDEIAPVDVRLHFIEVWSWLSPPVPRVGLR